MIVSIKDSNKKIKIDAPPSKSVYHRELIIRFLLGDTEHLDAADGDSDDVLATKAVLRAIREASQSKTDTSYSSDAYISDHNAAADISVNNITAEGKSISRSADHLNISDNAETHRVILPCNESGSTLRFMIPVAAAYLLGQGRRIRGINTLFFSTKGRLFDRPLSELSEALAPHGIKIDKDEETRTILVSGEMSPGKYSIDGSVSSQYISGLIMALNLFTEPSEIEVTGEMKSVHYIELTEDVMKKYKCAPKRSGNIYRPLCNGYRSSNGSLLIDPNQPYTVEGDWSNGAFLLCLSEYLDMEVGNLNPDSRQGDKAILGFLDKVHSSVEKQVISFDCSDIPDITPYMAIVAAFTFDEAEFTGISRLRIKESDRVMAVREQLHAAGIRTEETDETLKVFGRKSSAGYRKSTSADINTADSNSFPGKNNSSTNPVADPIKLSSYHDHRMAMCAILLSVISGVRLETDDIQCINKSFPQLLDYLEIS